MHAGARSSRPAPSSWPPAACRKRKTEYILDLADHFKAKRVHADLWAEMEDEAVIAELVQIRGIGRWTAEMFLIFNLLRPNILPLDDPGLLQRHQPELFLRRAGVAQRCARGLRQLGAVAHRRHLVFVA